MPIVGIRQVTVEEDWRPSGNTIGESIDIQSVTVKNPDTQFSDWDLSKQEVISIDFKHSASTGFGKVSPTRGRIEVRTGSGMLFVIADAEQNDIDQVIRDLRGNTDDSIRIKKRLVLGREPIWRFVLAGEPVRIDVVTPFGGVQRLSLQNDTSISDNVTLEDAQEEYPIDTAKVEFKSGNDAFDVRYYEDKLSVNSENNSDTEYTIQVFESALGD